MSLAPVQQQLLPSPRDGMPVTLWSEDADALPTYPVTVGVWHTDDRTGASCWRGFGGRHGTPASIRTASAGGHSLASTAPHARSPIQHHLVLHWIDPEQGIRRFYSLMIERDLFGTIRLVRHWGRNG
jgi:hypothetical protein